MSEPQPGAATAGSLLRAAREKQGLHIAALAAAIKVAQRKLEALEGDRYNELPDATFTRALAQTVCRTLKVDARPVLELLPPAPTVALMSAHDRLNTPFRERPGRDEPGSSAGIMRPMVWAAAALVLAALAVWLAPAGWWSLLRGGPAQATLPASSPASAAASAPAAAPSSEVLPQPASGTLAATMPAASQAMVETVFAAQNPDPAASEPAAASASPALLATGTAPTSAVPSGLVQLRTSEASWVEVRDARGQLLLSRTVQPGESVGLDGSLPMRLVIGNAAVTQLGFRGKPVDLAPSTRDNVARVELR